MNNWVVRVMFPPLQHHRLTLTLSYPTEQVSIGLYYECSSDQDRMWAKCSVCRIFFMTGYLLIYWDREKVKLYCCVVFLLTFSARPTASIMYIMLFWKGRFQAVLD